MKTRFYLWLFMWTRSRALAVVKEEFPYEYRDAMLACERGLRLSGDLATPAWNTKHMDEDVALHDAAEGMLGSYHDLV